MDPKVYMAFAAALCLLPGVAAAIGICYSTAKASESIARQPEAGEKIASVNLLGTALAEATAVYGLVAALILLLVSWGK